MKFSIGQIGIVRAILAQVSDKNPPNLSNVTPLHFAAQNGHFEVVKAIIDMIEIEKNPPEDFGTTPLHLSAMYDHLDIVDYIINRVRHFLRISE